MCAVLFGGCSKSTDNAAYVARVGDSTLTEQTLRAMSDGRTAQAARQYVSEWVANQLLYQEALRRGFTESSEVQEQLAQAKKQLAINALLQKELYSDNSAVTDEMMQREFTTNRAAYRLREDIARISFVVFEERDVANTFRSKILRGATWDEALRAIENDSTLARQILRKATEQYFTQAKLYPEELWKATRALTKEDVSFVIKTNIGYAVLLVHDTRKQGDLPEFEFVKDEIAQRISQTLRTTQYNEFIAELQRKYNVDVRFGEADSTTQEPQE